MASSQKEPDAEALEDEERQYGHGGLSSDADELYVEVVLYRSNADPQGTNFVQQTIQRLFHSTNFLLPCSTHSMTTKNVQQDLQ